jgi:hypothetical protein
MPYWVSPKTVIVHIDTREVRLGLGDLLYRRLGYSAFGHAGGPKSVGGRVMLKSRITYFALFLGSAFVAAVALYEALRTAGFL